MTRASAQRRFRTDVEGLRAVAVAAVVLSHVTSSVPGGFTGVDIFFVVSGFLITGIMLAEYGSSRALGDRNGYGAFSLRRFYVRRARRILPAAVACLVATVLVGRAWLNPGSAQLVGRDGLFALIFAENFHLISGATDYFQQGFSPSPVQHYWSLSVEEQFYFLWPPVFLLMIRRHQARLRRRQLTWLQRVTVGVGVITAVSFSYSLWLSYAHPKVAYFSSPARAFELGVGALAACWLAAGRRLSQGSARSTVSAGALLIGLGLAVSRPGNPYPGTAVLLPVLGTAMLLTGGEFASHLVSRGLSLPPIRFIGRISYSVYLWHWPIATLLPARLPSGLSSWQISTILIAVTVVISVASYYLVERPFLRHPPSLGSWSALAASWREPLQALTTVLAAVLALGLIVSMAPAVADLRPKESSTSPPLSGHEPPAPLSENHGALPTARELALVRQEWLEKLAAAVNARHVPRDLQPSLESLASRHGEQESLCHEQRCTTGEGSKHALILGNSFAQVLTPVVVGALGRSDWTVTTQWRSGCQIAFPDRCKDLFAIPRGIDLLILSDYSYTDARTSQHDVEQGLARAIPRLAGMAKQVVYFGQPPGQRRALIDCVDSMLRISRDCMSDPPLVRPINELKRSLVMRSNGTFIDPVAWLCRTDGCPVVIDGSPVYVDTQHLEASLAARWLGPLFRLALLDAGVLTS